MAANHSGLRSKMRQRMTQLGARFSRKEATGRMSLLAKRKLRCLITLTAWTVFSATAQAPARERVERNVVAPGVTYSHLNRTPPAGEPWSIHVLEMDRREKSIQLKAIEG